MQIIQLPAFDPVALQLGPLAIRWYSLAYIAGILSAMFFINYQNKKQQFMSQKAQDDWLMWAVLSIIIGGRLGYVLFYNIGYFLSNPLEIFAIWQGGMSFHGGLLGSIIGLFWFCRVHGVKFLKIADIIAVIAPLGIFFGRMANFINLELYGRPTNGDFGMIFPSDPLGVPRYPSQLFEGVFEGLVPCLVLLLLMKFTKLQQKEGIFSGLFLIMYAIARIIIENFREPDAQIGFLFGSVTMGQLLSVPLILLGLTVIFWHRKLQH